MHASLLLSRPALSASGAPLQLASIGSPIAAAPGKQRVSARSRDPRAASGAGNNTVTFNSKGKEAVHLIFAVPVKGKAPPLNQIKKDLASHGPPPPYVDAKNAQSTAILDGGTSQTTSLDLKKPGKYIFFCPLSDRDGGKPHFEEGLLKVQNIR